MSALFPINPANSLTALSQDFQAAPGIPVSIVGSGSGPGGNSSFLTILNSDGSTINFGLSTTDVTVSLATSKPPAALINYFDVYTDSSMTLICKDFSATFSSSENEVIISGKTSASFATTGVSSGTVFIDGNGFVSIYGSGVELDNVSSINGAAYRGANPQFSTIGVIANTDSLTEGITFGNNGCFLGFNSVPSTFEIKTGTNLDLAATGLMQIGAATVLMTGVSSINNVNFNALVSTVNGLAA